MLLQGAPGSFRCLCGHRFHTKQRDLGNGSFDAKPVRSSERTQGFPHGKYCTSGARGARGVHAANRSQLVTYGFPPEGDVSHENDTSCEEYF